MLNIDSSAIGLKGSPTLVTKIFSPEREKGEIIGDGMKDPKGTVELLVQKLIQKEILTF